MIEIKVPPKCKIGSHTYTTIFSKLLIDAQVYGRASHVQQVVSLNPTNRHSQNIVSWLHENLHIINSVYCAGSVAEKDIDGLAEGLAQLFEVLEISLDFSNIEELKLGNED